MARIRPLAAMTPAMTLAGFLSQVVGRLESASIDYMIAGSVASSVYGEPRTTRDIDIVVAVESTALLALFDAFDRELVYIDEPATGALVGPGQMFNLIDLQGGWKVDLMVKKDRPFSSAEFARRRSVEVLGINVMVASAEDVLLAKLEWSAQSGSTRQLEDARGIVAVQRDLLDLEYLRRWAPELGVEAALAGLID